MRLFALPLLCLAFFMLSACDGKENASLSGIYRTTFENGTIAPETDGENCPSPYKLLNDICVEPYEAENLLGIFENPDGEIDFAASLSFFNGHSCTIDGHAVKNESGWVYESNEDDMHCKLLIAEKDKTITLDVLDGFDCSAYCGARGNLAGNEFPLSSKTDQTVTDKSALDCIGSMEQPCEAQQDKE